MNEQQRAQLISEIHTHHLGLGDDVKRMVSRLLEPSLPTAWMYVFELTQNARDAGARRVSWTMANGVLVLQHDGTEVLEERHIRGLCAIGQSTKGAGAVGFMGVGFKSVFGRFGRVGVTDGRWQIRFTVDAAKNQYGKRVTDWFGALLPRVDSTLAPPDPGFTTRFELDQPLNRAGVLLDDLKKLVSTKDLTPLAVLALRGLEQIRVGKEVWNCRFDADLVEVIPPRGKPHRWQVFRVPYKPNKPAMGRYLQVRQELRDKAAEAGTPQEREVVGLMPLGEDNLPEPRAVGGVYATLPTQATWSFGLELQADWLVDITRQGLRVIDGDDWQEAIVQQVPKLMLKLLQWAARQPPESQAAAYRALRRPEASGGLVHHAMVRLRDSLRKQLSGKPVIPVLGQRGHATPEEARRLLPKLRAFAARREWSPQLALGPDVVDEARLGEGGVAFLDWLDLAKPHTLQELPWPSALPAWWAAMPEKGRPEALFALWEAVRQSASSPQEWQRLSMVPTESGSWVRPTQLKYLSESLPTPEQPGGVAVLAAIEPELPRLEERLPSSIHKAVQRGFGPPAISSAFAKVTLLDVMKRAFDRDEAVDALPELASWAIAVNRPDLIVYVQTESGRMPVSDVLVADPLVPGGAARRRLFRGVPVLHADYARVADGMKLAQVLHECGAVGWGKLVEVCTEYTHAQKAVAAEVAGVALSESDKPKIGSRFKLIDKRFPFEIDRADLSSLAPWLVVEYLRLHGFGRLKLQWDNYGQKERKGAALCTWVRDLQRVAWVPCTTGDTLRRPCEVLAAANPDYEDAPVTALGVDVVRCLAAEGVEFGSALVKSPAIRRLTAATSVALSDPALADLLKEVRLGIEGKTIELGELNAHAGAIRIHGRPLGRIVSAVGSGTGLRSGLDWVLGLRGLLPSLEAEIRALLDLLGRDIASTTTGLQALGFLESMWSRPPDRVENVRSQLAAAYRYVLDDLSQDPELRSQWQRAKLAASVFADRRWRSANDPSVLLDDVRNPTLTSRLGAERALVAANHLGDAPEQVARVADALGIPRLSTLVRLQHAGSREHPGRGARIARLLLLLSGLPDRPNGFRVAFWEQLWLDVKGDRVDLSSYADQRTLNLRGEPDDYEIEAAEQVVDAFGLTQQARVIPRLSAALRAADDAERFERRLHELARQLDLELPPALDPAEPITPEEPPFEPALTPPLSPKAQSDATPTPPPKPNPGPTGGTSHGPTSGPSAPSKPGTSSAAYQAKDMAGILALSRGTSETLDGAGPGHLPPTDHVARAAVIKYEQANGRTATECSATHPGYDIRSVDEQTNRPRYIEVKGVKGTFSGDSSVVLSARQHGDAVTSPENVDYWLYVVENTQSDEPTVLPIQWAVSPNALRYALIAKWWLPRVER